MTSALDIHNNKIVQVIKSDQFVTRVAQYGSLPIPVAQKMNDIIVQHFFDRPDLLRCDEASIYSAVLWCARLNLVPGFQHCAFVPRKGKCDFELMYRGYLELLKRHGGLKDSICNVVYEVEADDFSYSWDVGKEGSPEGGLTITHKQVVPKLQRNQEGTITGTQDKGELIAVWCRFRMEDGGFYSMMMDREQVLRVRDEASQQGSGKGSKAVKGPWLTWEEAMWRKTVIKNLAKMVPMSAEANMRIIEADTLDDHTIVARLAGKEKPAPPGIDVGEVVQEAIEIASENTIAQAEETVQQAQEQEPSSAPLQDKFEHNSLPYEPPRG
tara:strand:+ start:1120 stop:2097 length:978 start_codon:yes stop_codon:yes gene_type:complete